MHVTCPCCGSRYPLEAGLVEADGKRLAALFAAMEPTLGIATLRYLRLFKPAKQQLRNARAVKIVGELVALMQAGTICRDERSGMRRPATPAMWSDGMEQMLADAAKLTLPLANHNYLRAVVYAIADHADAQAERQRETALRAPAPKTHRGHQALPLPLHNALMRIAADQELGLIDAAEAKRRTDEVRGAHA